MNSCVARWMLSVLFVWCGADAPGVHAVEPDIDSAEASLRRAVTFFREHCSAGGGYVYRVSSDLKTRQGEEPVGATTAWIQPPGTPAVGLAYLEAYRLTRDPLLLEAARETASALIRGQLVSGGWDNSMEFDPDLRKRHAYRVDLKGESPGRRSNTTTFDDDKSQSALRFLMQLDRELQFEDETLHEATQYAIRAFLQAQYPNGAWPQRYSSFPRGEDHPVLKASYPDAWPREYSGVKYASFYTLNDGTISDLIGTMLDAWDIYRDERCLEAARRGGDFFLLAQLPDPQPGWAQQYNEQMHPVWARKFEPPAISGSESQGVMRTLLLLYRRTGDRKYLEPIPRALAYYRTCVLPDGQLARFYELRTNKPLYFTRQYDLVYTDDDLPTHYAFKVSNRLDQIQKSYDEVIGLAADRLWKPSTARPPKLTASLSGRAADAIDALDERGAWVETGKIETLDGASRETDVIESRTFIRNLTTLAEFIAASRSAR